ncbi:MAG: FtsW/RodA/SpoVE family cell cycle protein, partial [Muribaculaceae bacterium]|nr:FtsW/RodA/SpoVE family cell cycle protein [Muribaculaceae bacterium]
MDRAQGVAALGRNIFQAPRLAGGVDVVDSGEELGLGGCILLLLLLSAIVLRCIWGGRHASSPFSAYVCMGMAGMLLSQITFNVGMCLYVLPVMGLTLPFISYGGSSIIT